MSGGDDDTKGKNPLALAKKKKKKTFTQRECCVPPCVAGADGGIHVDHLFGTKSCSRAA